jgi:hypothetical protein
VQDWLHFDTKVAINSDLLPLREVTGWLRTHTEPSAVLLSNAFTIRNVGHDRGVLVDHTTVGVHYYHSALAERRMWVECPSYMLDQAVAKRRLCEVDDLYYRQKGPSADILNAGPTYIILDHSLNDGASFDPGSAGQKVFANDRFEVFHLKAYTDAMADPRAAIVVAGESSRTTGSP